MYRNVKHSVVLWSEMLDASKDILKDALGGIEVKSTRWHKGRGFSYSQPRVGRRSDMESPETREALGPVGGSR